MPASVEIRRAADRAVTKTSWLNSRHSFSFGDHYDPDNTHHGVLLVNNDDVVAPAAGFDTHPHRDMEIVTWVLDGSLAHRDSAGNSGVVYPGLAQRMSAGTGILHSEKNDSTSDPVRFIQMWVLPDVSGIPPSYQQHEVGDRSARRPPGDDRLGHTRPRRRYHHPQPVGGIARRATARGDGVELPAAPYLHLFVARGRLSLPTVRTTKPSWPRATRCGSLPPTRPESRLASPAKSWSGRCTPRSAANAATPMASKISQPQHEHRNRHHRVGADEQEPAMSESDARHEAPDATSGATPRTRVTRAEFRPGHPESDADGMVLDRPDRHQRGRLGGAGRFLPPGVLGRAVVAVLRRSSRRRVVASADDDRHRARRRSAAGRHRHLDLRPPRLSPDSAGARGIDCGDDSIRIGCYRRVDD